MNESSLLDVHPVFGGFVVKTDKITLLFSELHEAIEEANKRVHKKWPTKCDTIANC